ncbi:MAG TPA: hypothetical protein VFZ77_19285 [Acidimicrobiales bacterium]
MAKAKGSGNGRVVIVAAVVSFMAGCWMGMGSDATGDVYCVVTVGSAASRPGFAPGQLVPEADGGAGCQPGEPVVCGHWRPESGDDRRFVSEDCP